MERERRASRQSVRWRRHHHQLIGPQTLAYQAVALLDEAHHRQVDLVGEKMLLDSMAMRDHERDVDAWIARMECTEQWRHDVGSRAGTCTHQDTASFEGVDLMHDRGRFSEQCEDSFSMAQELLTYRCEHDPSPTANEEPQAQYLLERLDLLCDGGLREIERLRSPRIAEVLCHGTKHRELMHGEVKWPISWDGGNPFPFRSRVFSNILLTTGHGHLPEHSQHISLVRSIRALPKNSYIHTHRSPSHNTYRGDQWFQRTPVLSSTCRIAQNRPAPGGAD